jgi:hypothetical protein
VFDRIKKAFSSSKNIAETMSHLHTAATSASWMFHAVRGDKIPDDAPEWAKTMGNTGVGGPTSFDDENFFEECYDQLSTPDDQEAIDDWGTVTFQVGDPDTWIQTEARERQELFRMFLLSKVIPAVVGTRKKKTTTRRDKDNKPLDTNEDTETYIITPADKKPAYKYLEGLAAGVISGTVLIAKEKGYMTARQKSCKTHLSPEQFRECRTKACLLVTQKRRNSGHNWMPNPENKPFMSKAKVWFFANVWDNFPHWQRSARTKGENWSKQGEQKTRQAGRFARWWLTVQTLRMQDEDASRQTWRGAYNQNKAQGTGQFNRTRSALHASRTARNMSEGSWKNRTFRLGAFLKPWN